VNSTKFLIIAKIVRDVLAIPVTTVALESGFSTGGRVLNPFRSSLVPVMVEALICSQNWLKAKPLNFDSDLVDNAESYKLESCKLFDHFSLLLNLFCYLQILFNEKYPTRPTQPKNTDPNRPISAGFSHSHYCHGLKILIPNWHGSGGRTGQNPPEPTHAQP
jgi:hypothetical protein